MDHPLEVTTQVLSGWLVVNVMGTLDIATADELREHVLRLSRALPRPQVVLEFSHLTFCDSSGLNALVSVAKGLAELEGTLTLAAPSRQLSRILEITGLDRRLAVHSTVLDAISS